MLNEQQISVRGFRQQRSIPTQKVIVGGLAGAITTVAVFVLNTYILPGTQPIPGDIAAALTTIISFVLSYWVPPAARDEIVPQ